MIPTTRCPRRRLAGGTRRRRLCTAFVAALVASGVLVLARAGAAGAASDDKRPPALRIDASGHPPEPASVRPIGNEVELILGGTVHTLSLRPFSHAVEVEQCALLFGRLTPGGGAITLLDLSGASRGNREAGYCGAGIEGDLLWLELDESGVVIRQHGVHYLSCLNNIDSDGPERVGTSVRVRCLSFAGDKVVRTVTTFHAEKPEAGLHTISSEASESSG